MEIAELMILGFISLLLTFFQNYIAEICIPESAGNTMLPCRREPTDDDNQRRRLLWTEIMDSGSNRRSLATETTFTCASVSLQSILLLYDHKICTGLMPQSDLLLSFLLPEYFDEFQIDHCQLIFHQMGNFENIEVRMENKMVVLLPF